MAAALGGGASESAVLSDKVSKLLRVRKTVAKMLHKRWVSCQAHVPHLRAGTALRCLAPLCRGYDVLDEDLELDAAGFLRKVCRLCAMGATDAVAAHWRSPPRSLAPRRT